MAKAALYALVTLLIVTPYTEGNFYDRVKEIEKWLTKINYEEINFRKAKPASKPETNVSSTTTTRSVLESQGNSETKSTPSDDSYPDYNNYGDINIDINLDDLVFESPFNSWYANITKEASHLLKENKEILMAKNRTALRLLELYATAGALLHSTPRERENLRDAERSMRTKFLDAIKSGSKTCPDRPRAYKLALKSQNITLLKCIWESWHDEVGSVVKEDFTKMVNLTNIAARENGYDDAGVVWKIQDVEDKNADCEMKRLLKSVMPLYKEIHAYVRRKLFMKYYNGSKCRPCDRDPIPAHLTGNLIGQEWTELENLVLPFPEVPLPNFTKLMEERKYNQTDMAKEAEKFVVSLGFRKMTDEFWIKSVFNGTDDQELGCHPRAEDALDNKNYSIFMCAQLNLVDFGVIHHEMGHIVAFMESEELPYKFRHGVNQIFGEGLGDGLALSVTTPDHLKIIFGINATSGLTQNDTMSPAEKLDINALMRSALYVLPLIPYSYVLDTWRYNVFNGVIRPEEYNGLWWKLRKRYQGIAPPTERSEDKFDPGAIIHVALNVPYAKYFFSIFVEFQMHKALCDISGHEGPLYHCDIYNSSKAGEKLKSILKQGGSKPTVDLLDELTGWHGYSYLPLLEFYEPLHKWLKEQNKGYPVGWNKNFEPNLI